MSADQSAVSLNTACELLTGNLVDESGQLTLLMDRGRIVNLHIRGRWRDHLDAASLAKLLVVLPAKHQMMSLTRALHDFNSQNLRPDKMQAATSVHALSGDDRADEIARAAAGVWNELWRRYEVVDWTQPTVDTGT
ncbi:MAG: hypothetical protein L0G99_11060, partial [Propionibacteriales bacterium]|nr:hypothetical protein [Propionibacteriales bacterium]